MSDREIVYCPYREAECRLQEERDDWKADAERLYGALKREMEANDGKLLASTVWSGVLEDHEKLTEEQNVT